MNRVSTLMLGAFIALSACAAPTDARQSDAGAASAGEAASPTKAPSGLDLVPLTITSNGKTHEFTVEVARTSREQARGLMFRTELAPDAGMIFPFDRVRPASFWMKDTPTSLDIIFVRADGTIESIAANTTPYSLESVQSGEAVGGVLELVAGRSAELGIGPGDMVTWTESWDPAKRRGQ
ncbi:MAG: DUF192 domain-containing protein [Pseudomonadota bacterium]